MFTFSCCSFIRSLSPWKASSTSMFATVQWSDRNCASLIMRAHSLSWNSTAWSSVVGNDAGWYPTSTDSFCFTKSGVTSE